MRLVFDIDGVEREVTVAQSAAEATMGDLIEASVHIRVDPSDEWWADDHRHLAGDRLSAILLLDGSRIARSRLVRPRQFEDWSVVLSGGLFAGPALAVPLSRPLTVGRSREADISVDSASVSRIHFTVEREGDEGVRVKDAGSRNGTVVDGVPVPADGLVVTQECVVVAGGAVVTLRRADGEPPAPTPGSLHNVTPAGTVPFNRPPRPGRSGQRDTIEPPTRQSPSAPSRGSLATIFIPLPIAAVMVVVYGPRFALFVLMSPVIGIVTLWDQKRRHKRDLIDEERRFATALATFKGDLQVAAQAARAAYRTAAPDPATTLRRAALPSTRLWQRRPSGSDFLTLHAGVGDVPWVPPVTNDRGRLDEGVRAAVAEAAMPAAPVLVDLTDAGVVGIVGDRDGALAVARSLLAQAAVHCGPADLTVGVFCDPGREEHWSWTGWLPHVRRFQEDSGDQWTGTDKARSESLLRSLLDGIESHPTPGILLVIDSDVLTEGRDSPARSLLGFGRSRDGRTGQRTRVSGIVLAATEKQLPASCTTVIDVATDADGTVTHPGDSTTVEEIVLAGVTLETARRCARDLARFDDPELVVPGAALPELVRLLPLLGLKEITAAEIRRSWASATGIDTPIGVREQGPYLLDLVRDGPHGLVGGTTGSGKSEFLRSLVAGLAARNDPTRLTFILIDFKGGAAFAKCERLPHTIGTVSNLDEQLALRALRALRAETRYRQQLFADAGIGIENLDDYLATNPTVPLPRLLLVIDEFAELAEQFPDVLSSLVSVARVGRTLGVHMILATQRPAGVVNADILANSNLRVALRVLSREDSTSVIDVPAASGIGLSQKGRAYVKLGQDDITPVQTALATGQPESQTSAMVDVAEITFGRDPEPRGAIVDDNADTELDVLIAAIVEANDAAGFDAPRPVWPKPLDERVELAATADGPAPVGAVVGEEVQVALADDPDHQRQLPAAWNLRHGNLMLLGIPGSGTTTTLTSIALTLAAHYSPEELDLLVLDMGSRDLAPLADLPHTAAYVSSGTGAREQQVRLLKYLRSELDRRRSQPGGHRRTVLLLDGLAALKEEYDDDFEGQRLLDGLYRAYADGPDVGMWTAVATARARAVPAAIDEVTTQKWLFRLADLHDYATANVPPKLAPPAIPGRCVIAETRLHAHVAAPSVPLAEAVARVGARWGQFGRKTTVVGQLPRSVGVTDLKAGAALLGEPWRIPVGVRESDLSAAYLEAYQNEHVLVAGPARSGKSTLLLALREILLDGAHSDGQPLSVWGVAGPRSPLHAAGLERCVGEDGLPSLAASARIHEGRLVILVDDAERFADADQTLAHLVSGGPPDLHLVAAGRADALRGLYNHWTTTLRRSRCGILLQPNVDYDGALLDTPLPRRPPAAVTTARGYLCQGGGAEFVQFAAPSGLTREG